MPAVIRAPTPSESAPVSAEQRQVGDEHPTPRGGQHRQQRAEHRQVGQRVQQVDQERLRPLPQMLELRAEGQHPADDEQGDRHHVPVGQAGQHGAGIALLAPRRRAP